MGFLTLSDHNLKSAIAYLLLSIISSSPQYLARMIFKTLGVKTLVDAFKRMCGIRLEELTADYLIDQLRGIERRFDASSTFFFLSTRNGSDYSFHDGAIKELMISLLEQDCEVALHVDCRRGQNIRIVKHDLEKALGQDILGVRNHALCLITPFGWRDQVGVGMVYDSSFGYDSDIGFKSSCCLPFQPFDHLTLTVLPLLEIPPVIQDWTLHFEHGLDMSTDEAFQRCSVIAKKTHELGGVLTLIWHPNYDDELYPGWNFTYDRILEFCSSLGAWYATSAQLAEWWNKRNEVQLVQCDRDGQSLSLLLKSCLFVPGFCVRLSLPQGIFPKKVEADHGNATVAIDKDDFLVCLDIMPGDTKLTIETS